MADLPIMEFDAIIVGGGGAGVGGGVGSCAAPSVYWEHSSHSSRQSRCSSRVAHNSCSGCPLLRRRFLLDAVAAMTLQMPSEVP